jgi:exosome complex component RRP42
LSLLKKSPIVIEQLRKRQMFDLITNGKRLDGRSLEDIRDLEIEIDIIKKADGSAKVRLGNSEVIAGVKVETGAPFEEVLPIASPYIEPGPPDEETIELARVVDRGIRESQMIDLDKLVLIPGKIVYVIFVDCSIINADGNLFDATSYAVVAALLSSKLPIFEIRDEKVVDTGKKQEPPITTIPVSITSIRIGNNIIIDPTAEEEACMESRITITTNSNNEYTAIQKGSTGYFTLEQIKFTAQTARVKAETLRTKLKELIK